MARHASPISCFTLKRSKLPTILLDARKFLPQRRTRIENDTFVSLPREKERLLREYLAQQDSPENSEKKRIFRRYLTSPDEPHFGKRKRDKPKGKDAGFRLYWRKSQPVKNEHQGLTRQPSQIRIRYNNVRQLGEVFLQNVSLRQSSKVSSEVPSEVSNEISSKISSEISSEVPSEVSDTISSKVSSETYSEVPLQNVSPTFEWQSRFAFDGTVVPKQLSSLHYPAGAVAGHTPKAPRKRRTVEEKQKVKAVLTTPIPPLAEYLTPQMMDMIKQSPYVKSSSVKDGEDVVVLQSDEHRTRGQNELECYKLLSRLLRNIASEIVYREQRIVADEKMYREEGSFEDPE